METSKPMMDRRTGMVVLTEDQCWARLRSQEVGRLAVVVGLRPDIFPVNFRIHDGEIAIRTEAGTKLAAGSLMPALAFEVDGVDAETRQGWSIVVKGRGREPEDLEELVALDDLGLTPWSDAPKTRWLLITPTDVTGRATPGAFDRPHRRPTPPASTIDGDVPLRVAKL